MAVQPRARAQCDFKVREAVSKPAVQLRCTAQTCSAWLHAKLHPAHPSSGTYEEAGHIRDTSSAVHHRLETSMSSTSCIRCCGQRRKL